MSPPAAIVVHEPPAAPLEVFSSGAAEDAQKVLDRFWASKKQNTREAYENDVKAFAAFLGTDPRGLIGLLRVWPRGKGNALAIEWHTAMVAAKFAPATRARRLGVIRALTKALYAAGAIEHAITTSGPKVRRLRDVAGPTEEKIRRMFEACGEGLEGLRNRVILGIFVTMGLRRFELAELRVKHYDRERRRLSILGKGEEERLWKDVPPELADTIEAWLAATGVTDLEAPLVHALTNPGAGRPLSLRGMGFVVRSIGERAGVRVWPHALRHTAGTVSAERGHDLLEVQGLLRHANPATTMIYLDNQQKRGSRASQDLAKTFLGENAQKAEASSWDEFFKNARPEVKAELERLRALSERLKEEGRGYVRSPRAATLKCSILEQVFSFDENFAELCWENIVMVDDLLAAERVQRQEHVLDPLEEGEETEAFIRLFSGRTREHQKLCAMTALWLERAGRTWRGDTPYVAGRCDVRTAGKPLIYVECGFTNARKILAVLDRTDSSVGVVSYNTDPVLHVFRRTVPLEEDLFTGVTVPSPANGIYRPNACWEESSGSLL